MTVFITGLPRSGTSIIAGILAKSGVWTGDTIPSTGENPRGFFENKVIRETITKRMLREMGADILGVNPLPDESTYYAYDSSWLRDAVMREVGERDLWLYKDAKLSLLWQHWAESFKCAQWVIVRRDRDQVIESCLRTSFMRQHSKDRNFWVEFIQAYHWRLFELANSGEFVRYIDADHLIKGDHGQLIEVMRDINIPYDNEAVSSFVDPNYWHASR